MSKSILLLLKFWSEMKISSNPQSIDKIIDFQRVKGIELPIDLVDYFMAANGMECFYSAGSDDEGFLFYPLQQVLTVGEKFASSALIDPQILIFADYLTECWWYGIKVFDDNNYVIGIIPDLGVFKPITNSFSDFIHLYMEDSEKLYPDQSLVSIVK